MSSRSGMRNSRFPTTPETPRAMRAYASISNLPQAPRHAPRDAYAPRNAYAPRAPGTRASRSSALNDYRGAVQQFPVTFVIATSAAAAFAGYLIGATVTRWQLQQSETPLPPAPSSLGPLPTPVAPAPTPTMTESAPAISGPVLWTSALLLGGLLLWGSGLFSKPAGAR